MSGAKPVKTRQLIDWQVERPNGKKELTERTENVLAPGRRSTQNLFQEASLALPEPAARWRASASLSEGGHVRKPPLLAAVPRRAALDSSQTPRPLCDRGEVIRSLSFFHL